MKAHSRACRPGDCVGQIGIDAIALLPEEISNRNGPTREICRLERTKVCDGFNKKSRRISPAALIAVETVGLELCAQAQEQLAAKLMPVA